MTPIGAGYAAIERSVIECAYAGCETIWLVCDDDIKPLIRHHVGDYVLDPVWANRRYEQNRKDFQKLIPIYYAPLPAKDKNKAGSVWHVLHGASISTKISKALSSKIAPDRYYVSFPIAAYLPGFLREHRKDISSHDNFFVSYAGKTIKDDLYCGFTFNYQDYLNIKSRMKNEYLQTGKYPNEKTLSEVFSFLQSTKKADAKEYWLIDNWDNYCKFISDTGNGFRRPSKYILNCKEFNGIGVD